MRLYYAMNTSGITWEMSPIRFFRIQPWLNWPKLSSNTRDRCRCAFSSFVWLTANWGVSSNVIASNISEQRSSGRLLYGLSAYKGLQTYFSDSSLDGSYFDVQKRMEKKYLSISFRTILSPRCFRCQRSYQPSKLMMRCWQLLIFEIFHAICWNNSAV